MKTFQQWLEFRMPLASPTHKKFQQPTAEELVAWLVKAGWPSPEAYDLVDKRWHDVLHSYMKDMPPDASIAYHNNDPY